MTSNGSLFYRMALSQAASVRQAGSINCVVMFIGGKNEEKQKRLHI
jgi:hypothetical protein